MKLRRAGAESQKAASYPPQWILQTLLVELAALLVPRAVTPTRFNALAKRAFVHAAAEMSRFRNGKVNQSRVAVLTGLRRAEVRELLGDAVAATRADSMDQSAVETVMAGWCADKRYQDEHGGPRRLLLKGSKPSFALLVKQYGGDVPHRAVLNELCRLGVTRQVGQYVEVRTLSALRQRQNLRPLASVMPVLVDGIRLAAHADTYRLPASMHRLTLPANSMLDLKMVRERCASSIESMIAGLQETLGMQVVAPRGARQSPYSCSVSVLFVESKIPAAGTPATGRQVRNRKSPNTGKQLRTTG
jgi:hypothetical protein